MKGCRDCEAVAQQLLSTKYADMARAGHGYLAQAVEWLVTDYKKQKMLADGTAVQLMVSVLPDPEAGA